MGSRLDGMRMAEGKSMSGNWRPLAFWSLGVFEKSAAFVKVFCWINPFQSTLYPMTNPWDDCIFTYVNGLDLW